LSTRTRKVTGGFTLAALLAVLVTALLLAGIFAPTLAGSRLKSVQLRCATNLRQLGMAAQMYAQDDSRTRFPDCNGAVWPWDIPAAAAHALVINGASRETFYCPGNPEQNDDILWSFTAGTSVTSGFRVIGYALAFRSAGRVRATNITESLTPDALRLGNFLHQPAPSERVLIADATLSMGSDERARNKNNYTRIFGGWNKPHRSAHLNGSLPAGGNLVFLDGHTEWKRFEKMRVRTDGNPTFWW
jgi:type II secretory pathway pseudopilin PulG